MKSFERKNAAANRVFRAFSTRVVHDAIDNAKLDADQQRKEQRPPPRPRIRAWRAPVEKA